METFAGHSFRSAAADTEEEVVQQATLSDQEGEAQIGEVLEPMMKGHISAGKAIGTWLLRIAFAAVIILMLATGGEIAAAVQPW